MPLHAAKHGEHGLLFSIDARGDARGEAPQFLRVLEPARLVFEACVLTVRELRVLDLPRDMTEVVGASLGVRLSAKEVGDLAARGGKIVVGGARVRRGVDRAGKDIEDAS